MLNYNILFLWVSLLLFGCHGQTETKAKAPVILTAEEKPYYEDAARLALRDLLIANPGAVVIPEKDIEKYMKALAAIHSYILKSGGTPAANIHTAENPGMYHFAIIVDSSAKWIKHWVTYRTKTGNNAIDSLMAACNVEIETYTETPDRSIVFFKTTTPENIAALEKKFAAIKNSSPYPLSQNEAKEDITVSKEGGNDAFTFQSRTIDKQWRFVVDKDFNITLGR